MAFKGGFLIKPTETGVSALANLYMQGKMAIAQKKEEIDKQTSESVANLNDVLNFGVTGIQDYDSMMLQYAHSTRQQARFLKDKFDKREIGLSDFNAGMSRLTADSKLASQYPAIMKDQLKSIREGVDKGELSGINLELTGFFKDKGASPQGLKSNYQFQYVGSVPTYLRTYEYIENDQIKTATESSPLSDIVDPNRATYKKVDTDADVKTFVDILGDKGAVGKYDEVQDINGTKVYARISDRSKIESIQKYIEDRVESYSDRDLVSIAFDELGFSNTSFNGYDEKSLKRRAERRRGAFKDASGKEIDFSYEDLQIKRNERGDFYLDEKSSEIVRGYLRNKHYAAISETYDEKFISPPAEPKDPTKDELFKALQLSPGTIGRRTGETILDIAKSSMREYNALATGAGMTTIPIQQGEPSLPPNSMIKYLLQDVGVKDKSTESISIPAELQTYLSKTFRVTSFTGQPIKGVKSIIVTQSKEPTEPTSIEISKNIKREIKEDDFHIMVMGPSALGKVKAGTDPKISVVERDVIVSESLSDVLTDSQAQELYQTLWDSNDQFKNVISEYGRNTKEYKKALWFASQRLNF